MGLRLEGKSVSFGLSVEMVDSMKNVELQPWPNKEHSATYCTTYKPFRLKIALCMVLVWVARGGGYVKMM